MLKEEIGYGDTVEEATEDAKLKLGVRDDEDIQIDIITMPKKKVMGIFGGCKAEVKVSVERKEPARTKKPAKGKAPKKEQKKEQVKEQVKQREPEKAKAAPENAVDAAELESGSRAAKAVDYLKNVLSKLGCENVDMKVAEQENGALIYLEGDGLGIIIGHRGETLDALQHLVSLSARTSEGYYKVTLNIGDYRERREDTLISLAHRVAEQVLKTGRGKALEPMNPYERRIIHTAVQDIEGVTSSSVGEGAGRRVVIIVEGGDVNEVRVDRYNRSRGGRGGHGDNRRGGMNRGRGRERRPSNTVATAPTRAPKADSDVPLYGKIK